MQEYHLAYPNYNFAQHKGYPTLEHRNLLLKHGPCAIHRLTFGPVKVSLKVKPLHRIKYRKEEQMKRKNALEKKATSGITVSAGSDSRGLRRSARLQAKESFDLI